MVRVVANATFEGTYSFHADGVVLVHPPSGDEATTDLARRPIVVSADPGAQSVEAPIAGAHLLTAVARTAAVRPLSVVAQFVAVVVAPVIKDHQCPQFGDDLLLTIEAQCIVPDPLLVVHVVPDPLLEDIADHLVLPAHIVEEALLSSHVILPNPIAVSILLHPFEGVIPPIPLHEIHNKESLRFVGK